MFIIALNHSVLSTTMSASFYIPMAWLSLVGSTVVYNMTVKVVTFQMATEKRFTLTRKVFAQILKLTNVGPFHEVSNEQMFHMFNEMGYQPPLTKISNFKKSSLPCIHNFLFGIFL